MSGRAVSPIRSEIAWSEKDKIIVRNHDLANELMGHIDLGEMAFLQIAGRLPTQAEGRVFNAMLVSLVEHGLTPSALATRMTVAGAPEALQASVAAGLLGLGSVFVGSIEGSAEMLQNALGLDAPSVGDLKPIAASIVDDYESTGRNIPGLGHPVHKEGDPRSLRLFALAEECGVAGPGVHLLQAIEELLHTRNGKLRPINATGAVGALSYDLGIPWQVARGLGVISRCIGLVGHVLEELSNPIAHEICRRAEFESATARQEASEAQ